MRAKIIGTGSYLPEKIVTNDDLSKMVETSDEWITTRTGIKARRVTDYGTTTSDLAVNAAKKAIESSGINPLELDFIIVATCTPDTLFPSVACILQDRLGAKNAGALDVSAACSGFNFALATAASFIESGKYKNILVVGADTLTIYLDWQDRNTCVLFGDGAGAVVLSPTEKGDGILSTHIYSDGTGHELICMPGGGSRNPISNEILEKKLCYVHMNGRETFKIAVKMMEKASRDALKANNLKP